MPLIPGQTLASYEILALLGKGGMGEVYKARDPKLDRDVAIKVLPSEFAQDEERLLRFRREAKLLASLEHPHIAAIHGFETAEREGGEPTHFLVLEYVEGVSLSQRLENGPLPVDEALELCEQIASGLEAAHDKGIVHRDLKPGNVMLRPDGTVKILDFGLARAMGEESSSSASAQSPTITADYTQPGVVLGTAAYMSPEQARGRTVDRRTDIWSFGCVLYECLTGKVLFSGESASESMGAILHKEPEWSLLPSGTPPAVQLLLRRCLVKDRRRRRQCIGDARVELQDAFADPNSSSVGLADAGPGTGGGARSRLPWALAITSLVAVVVVSVIAFSVVGRVTPPAVVRFTVEQDPDFFELSPDGRAIVLMDQGHLWVRRLDSLDRLGLAGTDGATYPFWSPDGEWIGFFADGQLKKVSWRSGVVVPLADAPDGRGGSWSRQRTIVFAANFGEDGLARIPDEGGTPRAVTTVGSGGPADAHRYPWFLPDGVHFLYLHLTSSAEAAGVYVGSLEGTPAVRVLDVQYSARYARSRASAERGHLLFPRESILMAQAFDATTFSVEGARFPVADGVGLVGNTGSGAFSVSDTGILAFSSGAVFLPVELAWFDRAGARVGTAGQAIAMYTFALSPDGRQLALLLGEYPGVWLQDLPDGTPTPFMREGLPGWTTPIWTPDNGEVIVATLDLAGLTAREVRAKPVTVAGNERVIARSDEPLYAWDISPDGTRVLGTQGRDLVVWPIDGSATEGSVMPRPGTQMFAQFSPDGTWIAYASEDGGAPEVFVEPYPEGERIQVSRAGGLMPRWGRDGTELFFCGVDGRLRSVPVVSAEEDAPSPAAMSFGIPRLLSVTIPSIVMSLSRFAYQPSADGQRFLVMQPVAGASPGITVVLNWEAELETGR